ncbi:hypothetical protein [Saccharopolyspora spinosa]|uniref:hypothetical protein n=1 Tax=Saccharopolyspora spinosa TaxID=60894 RepID=UPI00023788E8|nr:hypothetical protein [Saccharopolyspora spinosa]
MSWDDGRTGPEKVRKIVWAGIDVGKHTHHVFGVRSYLAGHQAHTRIIPSIVDKSLALIALARRLVDVIRALLRDGRTFQITPPNQAQAA